MGSGLGSAFSLASELEHQRRTCSLDLAAAAAPVGLPRLGFTSVGEVGSHGRRRVGARLHLGGGHSRRRRASEEDRNEERLDILFAIVGSVRTQPSGTNWALSWPT
jgi:hypothetical protein